MAYDYKYNPLTSMLDIVGESSAANGGGGKFVGVSGIMLAGSYSWARIAQIQFTCDDITDGEKRKNICFDGQFFITNQQTNPYSWQFVQRTCKLDVHILSAYITDSNDQSSHYPKFEVAMFDNIGLNQTNVAIAKTAQVISGNTAYVYFDLFVQIQAIGERYFYTFVTNASKDEYNRIKIVPVIAEAPSYAIYGWQKAKQSTNYYKQTFTNVSMVTVTHNLNKIPPVVVVDSENKQVLADVEYISENSCVVRFSETQSGTIYCN